MLNLAEKTTEPFIHSFIQIAMGEYKTWTINLPCDEVLYSLCNTKGKEWGENNKYHISVGNSVRVSMGDIIEFILIRDLSPGL